MVGCKLSKNDWVTPFFVIFRSVREILLVTVFFDHPVVLAGASPFPSCAKPSQLQYLMKLGNCKNFKMKD